MGEFVSRVGATPGLRKNCKTGDILVELGPESAAPSARYVIEVKDKGNYTLASARKEIADARANREAQIGVFVFSAKHAPEMPEKLLRFGNDVFVVWDEDNPESDIYLRVALTLARALCVRMRKQSEADAADLQQLTIATLEIEKQVEALTSIETWTETISNNCTKILKAAEAARRSLETQVRVLSESLIRLQHHPDEPRGE